MNSNRSHWAAAIAAAFVFAMLAGCAGGPTQPSTGEFLDDRVISTKVKTRLLNAEDVGGLNINVDTFKGEVTLTGVVGSEKEKTRAATIARGVAGVKVVKNYLEVRRE